ncbi:MAG TPA: hypothetical protein VI757_12325 [Bacteroidia bacterium]|nr:hypothetical protein [Bacteroidia bacterium]
MITKITEEEYLNSIVKGRGRASNVFTAILNMKPGEIINIPASDWKRRRKVSSVASYIAKRYKRKFVTVTLADGNGWRVKRLE